MAAKTSKKAAAKKKTPATLKKSASQPAATDALQAGEGTALVLTEAYLAAIGDAAYAGQAQSSSE